MAVCRYGGGPKSEIFFSRARRGSITAVKEQLRSVANALIIFGERKQ